MRVAPPVTLSPEERTGLARRSGGRGTRRLRARIVLFAASGLQDVEIAARLGVDRQTVAHWRRRFLVARLPGLESSIVGPRRATIPEETLQAIVRATLAAPSGSLPSLSTRRLARQFGVSHMTIRRVWDAYGIRPVRFLALPHSNDPVAAPVPSDLVGLVLQHPLAAIAWALSAAPTIRGPVRSDRRERPGVPVSVAGGLPGIPRSTLAFRALAPGRDAPAGASAQGPSLVRFVASLEPRIPRDLPVRIVATGLAPSPRAALDRWRIRHPRFEVDIVPDLATWRSQAIGMLRRVGRPIYGPGSGPEHEEVTRSLARMLSNFSTEGPAFEWRARPQEIRVRHAIPRLRYDLAVTAHPGFKRPGGVESPVRGVEPEEHCRASARSVLRRYLRVRPRERVTVESWTSTLEEANAFVLESLRIGARPLLLYQDEATYWAATTEVPARSLAQVGEHRRAALERTDVFVSFFGPSDRERFHALPSQVRFRLGEYQDALYEATARAGARAVQMAVGRVSDASARMYGVDPVVWRSELIAATIVEPRVLKRRARLVAERLESGREIEIRHPNGTDLRLRLRGCSPIRSDGSISAASSKGNWSLVTLPAGVVTVALDETFAEGVFESNVLTSVGFSFGVGEVRAGRWIFEGGRLRRFRYREGEEMFSEGFRRAGEGKDRPGALSIGLNEHLDRSPLLEDQALGTITLQVGRNDYVGGRTKLPWWAWLNLRGADLSVDGRTVLRRGRLAG